MYQPIAQPIKRVFAGRGSALDYPLVVNSFGRSGSTLLHAALIDAASPIGWPRAITRRCINRTVWQLDNTRLDRGQVNKTHDLPPPEWRFTGNPVRVVYVFADPVDMAISVLQNSRREPGWMAAHFEHLRVSPADPSRILDEDILQIERHMDAWLDEKRIAIAFVRYETLWQHASDVGAFAGVSLELPARRERAASTPDPDIDRARAGATYARLQERLDCLPDFFVHEPASASSE